MAYFPFQPGQQPMSSSQGVVIASDQSPVSIAGTVNIGTIPGSIIAFPTGNQSVSGTVGASVIGLTPVAVSNFPTNQNVSGSVVAFQGGAWANTNVGSVITVGQGSIAVAIISGSIVASFTSPANQSVSGTVGASIIGLTPVSVSNFPANQSISGTLTANQGGNAGLGSSWPVKISNGTQTANVNASSMLSVSVDNSPTVSGSVATVIIGGSIAASFTPPANQSVSGTVGASIIGLAPVNITNTNLNVSGSIIAFQGGTWTQSVVGQGAATALTNGWPIINGEANDSTGTFTNATQTTSVTNNNLDGYGNSLISITGTYGTATAIFEGSDDGGTTWFTVAAARDDTNVIETGYTSLTNTSRSWQINNSGFDSVRVRSTAVASGTVNVRISSSAAPNSSGATVAIGAALPAGTNVIGAVAASISGTVLITGSVQQGTTPWLIGSVYGNISGSVAATITNTNLNVGGSVVAFQGTSPWVVNFQNSSIIAIQSGSVVSLSVGSTITVLQAPSIVGTYAEDAPSASGDKGFLVMGARNDTLASVTSNDGDYSSHVVGPAGELIAENAPLSKWVSGTASMLGGVPLTTSVTVIAAQGASIFTYITGVQVVNFSASSVLVSFGAATSSLIAYTIAPPGGGSNIYYQNGLKTNANAAFSASVSGTASVYISAQGFISKT